MLSPASAAVGPDFEKTQTFLDSLSFAGVWVVPNENVQWLGIPCNYLTFILFTFSPISRYAGNLDAHFKDVVLRHMPPNLQTLDKSKTGMM